MGARSRWKKSSPRSKRSPSRARAQPAGRWWNAAARPSPRSAPATVLKARLQLRRVWSGARPDAPSGTAMAFFRSVSFSELLPAVTGKGVYLRPPAATDYSEWAELREQSREFLTPWEPVWPADDL